MSMCTSSLSTFLKFRGPCVQDPCLFELYSKMKYMLIKVIKTLHILVVAISDNSVHAFDLSFFDNFVHI